MAQYKTNPQTGTPTVDVTNGSATVIGNDTEFMANVTIGDHFRVQSINVPYTVASKVSDTEITISPVWAGSTLTDQSFVIARDFTTEYNLVELSKGDKEWPEIYTFNLRIIDAELKAVSDAVASGMITGGNWALTSALQITGDDVVIGEAVTPDAKLHIVSDTDALSFKSEVKCTSTNTAGMASQLLTSTPADMVDGFGTLSGYYIEDSAGVENLIGQIGFQRAGADNSGKLLLKTVNAGTPVDALSILPSGQLQVQNGSASAPVYSFAADTDDGFYHSAASEISAAIAGYQKVVISSSGVAVKDNSGTTNVSLSAANTSYFLNSVSIGTVTPLDLLHLEAADCKIRVKDTGSTGYSTITALDTGGISFSADAGNTDADTVMTFLIDGTEAARFNASRYFALGTTDPKNLLHLAAGSTPGFILEETGASATNKMWDVRAVSEQLNFRVVDDAYASGVSWLQVDRTGNTVDGIKFPNGPVLIGSPTATSGKLNIAGSVRIETAVSGANPSADADDLFVENNANTGLTIGSSITGTGSVRFADSGGSQGQILYDHSADFMDFITAGSGAMRINSGQNVYIGPAGGSATTRLEVHDAATVSNDARFTMLSQDTTAFAQGVGGGIGFSGKYNAGGSIQQFAGVWAEKENATDNNYASCLKLGTRPNGGAITTAMIVDSAQNVNLVSDLYLSNTKAIYWDNSSATPQKIFHLDSGNDLNIDFPDKLYLSQGGTIGKGISIAPTGYVGVGMAEASCLLDLEENAYQTYTRLKLSNIAAADSTNEVHIDCTLKTDGGTTRAGFKAKTYFQSIVDASRTSVYELQTANIGSFDTRFAIVGDKIGMGTGSSTPNQKLQLHDGTSGAVYFRISNLTTGLASGMRVGMDASEIAWVWNDYNTDMIFGVNNDTKFKLDTEDQHVIYGDFQLSRDSQTYSLTRALEIQGARSSSGVDFARINFTNYDVAEYTTARISAQNRSGVNSGALYFYTGDTGTLTQRMLITEDGNIELGTDSDICDLLVNGNISGSEQSANPTSPDEGFYTIWMSDGTAYGDDGDIMIMSTAGGVTRYATLFDHSTGALVVPTSSKAWYVRPAGGSYGTEDGTSYENAWDGFANIVWGTGGIEPGDTLYICDTFGEGGLVINDRDGTSDKYITLRGDYPSHAGLINGGTYCISLTGSDYIQIKNITLYSATGTALDSSNTPNSDYIIVDNVTIYDADWGMQLWGESPIVRNCTVHDVDTVGIYQKNSSTSGNVQIYNNVVYNFGTVGTDCEGIHINDSGECYNNEVYNGYSAEGGTCGIDSSNPDSGHTVYIHHNIIHDVLDRGIGPGDETGNNTFYVEFNLVYNAKDSFYARNIGTYYVRNNTFVASTRRGISMQDAGTKTCYVYNNIVNAPSSSGILWNTASSAVLYSDNNCFYNCANVASYDFSAKTLTQWQGYGYDANSIEDDPDFVNESNDNYQLLSTSPCRDIGNNSQVGYETDLLGNDAIQNVTRDLGAYEYNV